MDWTAKMADFFRGQFDYIYFFYGLSFLFLALICFSIDRKRSPTMPWVLYGFFGLFHGINEWLDLAVIFYGPHKILSLIHPVILGVSYLLLFEFALVGYARIEKKMLAGRWVYVLLFFMIFLAARSGNAGLSAGMRYFLGFPAAALSSCVVWIAARKELKQKPPLYVLSVILALYALFTGLIVPKADFLLAPFLNFDSFNRFSSIPVQFIRGIIALSSAMAVWFYSPLLSDIKYIPQKARASFKLTKWGILFTIVSLLMAGWLFTNYLDYYAGIQIIKNSKEKANSPLNHLIKELSAIEKLEVSLSRSLVVRNAVLASKDIEKVSVLFERYFRRFGMRSCFLLDYSGKIIASVGQTTPEIIQEKAAVPVTYFKDALAGNTGFTHSIGSKYSERIYYVSYPVKDTKGGIAGIILITKVIPVKPVLQYRLFSIVMTLFVCLLTLSFFILLRKREGLIEYIDRVNSKLQEIDKLKTDFVSIVSHELRTPLTSINNAATILMKNTFHRQDVDPQEKELLEIIIKNTGRQMRMIGDLLDVSKIEAGVMPVLKEHVDIIALVDDVVRSFQPQAASKNIQVDMSCTIPDVSISIDAEHTRRIMTNLLSNALKYTLHNGKIHVTMRDEPSDIVISVSDTGPGIPKEAIERLFTKFYRVSDTASRQLGGTGLGLMITKGLVEAQGGRIWLDSELGKGSTFYFSLPKKM